jgi:hypothetical protein
MTIGDERTTADLASERIRRWFDDVAAANAILVMSPPYRGIAYFPPVPFEEIPTTWAMEKSAREDPDPAPLPGVG